MGFTLTLNGQRMSDLTSASISMDTVNVCTFLRSVEFETPKMVFITLIILYDCRYNKSKQIMPSN